MSTARPKKRISQKPSRVARAPAVHIPRSTLAEHVHRIGILGERIGAYLRFMSEIEEHAGLSDETKTRAAIAFYEKLIVVEQELGRIHEQYQLE